MSRLFGDYIRKKRESLRKGNPEYSIRKVAKRIGIHHSYLSKVERGEPATLSEARIFSLAEELGENPELLMAMNGKISEEVRRAIFKSPELFSHLLRQVKDGDDNRNALFDIDLTVLRSLRDMFVMQLDADMRVLWAKSAPERPDDLVGQKCYAGLFGADTPCQGCSVPQAMATGAFAGGEVQSPSGGTWLVGSTPLNTDNSPSSLVHVAVDVTKGKEVEQYRAESEGLMFHDLRSPLSGIVNMAKSLQQDGNLTSEQLSCLAILAKTGEQLMGQVSRSMDIHLLESGRIEYRPVKIDLGSIVRDIASGLTSNEAFDGINLELSIDGRPLMDSDAVWALADNTLVVRMLTSLATNAFEASESGDVVRIGFRTDASVLVNIHNPAPVPEPVRDLFFEKYVTHGKYGGQGLGTYGAKLMAEAMGGTISLETGEDVGTTVTVVLPS